MKKTKNNNNWICVHGTCPKCGECERPDHNDNGWIKCFYCQRDNLKKLSIKLWKDSKDEKNNIKG